MTHLSVQSAENVESAPFTSCFSNSPFSVILYCLTVSVFTFSDLVYQGFNGSVLLISIASKLHQLGVTFWLNAGVLCNLRFFCSHYYCIILRTKIVLLHICSD